MHREGHDLNPDNWTEVTPRWRRSIRCKVKIAIVAAIFTIVGEHQGHGRAEGLQHLDMVAPRAAA
jgi:hypothetical protein